MSYIFKKVLLDFDNYREYGAHTDLSAIDLWLNLNKELDVYTVYSEQRYNFYDKNIWLDEADPIAGFKLFKCARSLYLRVPKDRDLSDACSE